MLSWQVIFLDESNFYTLCAIILLDKTCWRKLHNWEDWYHYKCTVITLPGPSTLPGNLNVFPNRLMLLYSTRLSQSFTLPPIRSKGAHPQPHLKKNPEREALPQLSTTKPKKLPFFLHSCHWQRRSFHGSGHAPYCCGEYPFPLIRIMRYFFFSVYLPDASLPTGSPSLTVLARLLTIFQLLASSPSFSLFHLAFSAYYSHFSLLPLSSYHLAY